MALRRFAPAAAASLIALALAWAPVYAATTKPAAKQRPTPVAPVKKSPVHQPPQIYQINPTKVNPTVEPNIMIVGQDLTPTTTVQVGGREATTVQAPDQNHLLVKLPDNLGHGSYTIEVTNEAGTAVASDPLVVDDGTGQFSTLQIVAGAGVLILLVLVLRMARTPGLS
jgi:methionine-rich copper-binding protein CopC